MEILRHSYHEWALVITCDVAENLFIFLTELTQAKLPVACEIGENDSSYIFTHDLARFNLKFAKTLCESICPHLHLLLLHLNFEFSKG